MSQENRPNELRPELLHTAGLNPFQREDSSARVNMFSSSHISQALVVEGATPRRTLTGVERKFGRTTFKIKMPCNGTILKIFRKYPESVGFNSFQSNPETILIYEDAATQEIGMIRLPKHHSLHQHFGFKYRYTQTTQRIYQGATIRAGTVLADSPSVTPDGDYCYGVNANVALMSIPNVIEDGVVVSESFAKKLRSKGYETTVESWGKDWYPLNLYGDDQHYKPFPDIGDVVREDGLLLVLRKYDDLLAPVEMTRKALREPDYIYDKKVYVTPGARVVDISVKHDSRLNPPPTPTGMEEQTERYYHAHQKMYKEVIDFYYGLKRERPQGFRLTREFHNFIVEAMIDTGDTSKDRSMRMYRRIPLDDWRVEITLEYDIQPTVTYKLTATHGNKGVIVNVWPDERMPVDAEGNRADVIMEGWSIIKRMNPGMCSEMLITAAGRTVSNKVVQWAASGQEQSVTEAYNYLMGFYGKVSPKMHAYMSSPSYKGTAQTHVADVVRDGVYLYLPTDNPIDPMSITRNIIADPNICPPIGPVSYVGDSGRRVTTKENVLIGQAYILLLEKIGNDWSAVASAKLQHHGLPARLTNRDKHGAPGREHPVRFLGEDEARLTAATTGPDIPVELIEMSNNPALHKHMQANILRAEKPTAIENIVDRDVIPKGGSRPLVYIKHMMGAAGIEFAYSDPREQPPTVYFDELLTGDDEAVIDDEEEDKVGGEESSEEDEETGESEGD
jgi:hypothetical protein